jgi:hypothetical protein
MIGMKKEVPEFLTKWEKEHNIVSYHWTEQSVTDIKTGKKTVISTKREYGVNNRQQLINLPKEIKEYFENPKAEIKEEPKEVKTDKKK